VRSICSAKRSCSGFLAPQSKPGSNEAGGGAGCCGGLVEPLLSAIIALIRVELVAARLVSCGIFGGELVLISPLSLAAAATAAAAVDATRLALVAPDEPTEPPEFDFPLEIPLLIVIDECCPPIDGGIDL